MSFHVKKMADLKVDHFFPRSQVLDLSEHTRCKGRVIYSVRHCRHKRTVLQPIFQTKYRF